MEMITATTMVITMMKMGCRLSLKRTGMMVTWGDNTNVQERSREGGGYEGNKRITIIRRKGG